MLICLLSILEDERSRETITAIYNEHCISMEKTALAIFNDQGDAEDAVQNAFLQVVKHFDQACKIPRKELRFWLICIVKNEALMILRKKNRFQSVPPEDWDAFAEAAETVETAADGHALAALFTRLPETYRAVLEMKLLLGYTDREIDLRLGLSETAVSTRAGRGRALLRKLADKEGFHP